MTLILFTYCLGYTTLLFLVMTFTKSHVSIAIVQIRSNTKWFHLKYFPGQRQKNIRSCQVMQAAFRDWRLTNVTSSWPQVLDWGMRSFEMPQCDSPLQRHWIVCRDSLALGNFLSISACVFAFHKNISRFLIYSRRICGKSITWKYFPCRKEMLWIENSFLISCKVVLCAVTNLISRN